MKIKKLRANQVVVYPYRISVDAEYADRRAVLRPDGLYSQFTGEPEYKGKQDFIVYDVLSDYEVLKLQLILVDPATVKNVDYARQLLRLVALKPLVKLSELSNELCVESQWILDKLRIAAGINMHKVCIANAYGLSKVKDRGHLMNAAETVTPAEFMPICAMHARQERGVKKVTA
jgi:hypothetical protein